MSNLFRVKCSCGKVLNAAVGNVCPKCKQPLKFSPDGMISIYRKGSPLGIAGGFGLYLNGEPYGHIGNRETVKIPVAFGTYTLHVAAGMNRRCTDLIINVTLNIGSDNLWFIPFFFQGIYNLLLMLSSECLQRNTQFYCCTTVGGYKLVVLQFNYVTLCFCYGIRYTYQFTRFIR